MEKTILIGLIIGAIGTAMILSSTIPSTMAAKKNLFGQEAAENAKNKDFAEGSMGDHSKAGGAAGDPPFDQDRDKGRDGIPHALGGQDHPSDVIATLCGDEGENC
ncbi:MAG: hypothetical protein ACRD8W_19120 [Nitrososphaeraceae archaeon]